MTKISMLLAVLLLSGGCGSSPLGDHEAKLRGLTYSRKSPMNDIVWTPVARFDFDDPAELDRFVQVAGGWTIRGGKLVAIEGDRDRTIMLAPSGPMPVRIAFDARLGRHPEGGARDFTVLVNATADEEFFRSGYTLTTGSYRNNTTCFYRAGKRLARTEYSPLEVERTYRVTVEIDGGHLRYWLDDRILLEAWDADPLAMDPKRWIGLRTWDIEMAVDNLTIDAGRREGLAE